MKRSKKGFSLIEILIVLSLSAVLVGLVGLSASMLARANVNKAANKLERMISKARATAMSKGEVRFNVTYSDNKIYAWIGDDGSQKEVIASGNIMFGGELDLSCKGVVLTSDSGGYGSHVTFNTSGGLAALGDGIRYVVADKHSKNCTEIIVYSLTGKTEINSLR